MAVKELKQFLFENYYMQIGFAKDSYYAMKNQKNKDLLFFATKKNTCDTNTAEQYLKKQNQKIH